MNNFIKKLILLKIVLTSESAIVIYVKDHGLSMIHSGRNYTIYSLYQRLIKFIPNWLGQFNAKHKNDETD